VELTLDTNCDVLLPNLDTQFSHFEQKTSDEDQIGQNISGFRSVQCTASVQLNGEQTFLITKLVFDGYL
jgi:hypothetical protein